MADSGLCGAVLTGGRSSRMGSDKAVLRVDGVPMASRVTGTLRRAGCSPVWCQGGDVAALRRLGLDVRPDSAPGCGPVGAIRDALAAAGGRELVVAACDLPDLDAATVDALVLAARTGGGDVVAAATTGDAHLVSWWSPSAAGALAALLADGVVSYRRALERLGATLVEVEPAAVHNVNRPDELDRPARP